MNKLIKLFSAFSLLLIISGNVPPSTANANSDPPNIVFIFADDLGWSDVGYNGSRYYETPNINKLAKESMRFSDAYVAAPENGKLHCREP